MKIKFPFFSKKFPWVCTTEQIVHQVDGKDKKLSEVLNSYDEVPITINGKSPIEYIEDSFTFVKFAVVLKLNLGEGGLYSLWPNTAVNVEFKMTSESSADIDLQGVFYASIGVSIEPDAETEEPRAIVGEFIVNAQTPEHIRSFIASEVGPRVRETFETIGEDIQDIFDYFNAQYSNN